MGTDATGFTFDVKVNGESITPTLVDNLITIDGLVQYDVVDITIVSADDPSETDTDSYTVA